MNVELGRCDAAKSNSQSRILVPHRLKARTKRRVGCVVNTSFTYRATSSRAPDDVSVLGLLFSSPGNENVRPIVFCTFCSINEAKVEFALRDRAIEWSSGCLSVALCPVPKLPDQTIKPAQNAGFVDGVWNWSDIILTLSSAINQIDKVPNFRS